MKSLEQFTDDFVPGVSRKFDNVRILSFDTKSDRDGRNFTDVLNYFNNIDVNNFKVHIHGNDSKVKQQII
jgi:hypothetical protein